MTKKDLKTAEKNLAKQIFGNVDFTKTEEIKSRHPADGKIVKAANYKDYGQE